MKPYLAIAFAKEKDRTPYLREVAEAIRKMAGSELKYGEAGAALAAIAFISDREPKVISQTFQDLWRREQRTWVLPLDSPVLIDHPLMEWVRKHSME